MGVLVGIKEGVLVGATLGAPVPLYAGLKDGVVVGATVGGNVGGVGLADVGVVLLDVGADVAAVLLAVGADVAGDATEQPGLGAVQFTGPP